MRCLFFCFSKIIENVVKKGLFQKQNSSFFICQQYFYFIGLLTEYFCRQVTIFFVTLQS